MTQGRTDEDIGPYGVCAPNSLPPSRLRRATSLAEGGFGKAVKLVQEWGEPLKAELMAMWDTKTLKKLPPLE